MTSDAISVLVVLAAAAGASSSYTAFWAAFGIVATAFLGYLGVRLTARQSNDAKTLASKMEERAVDAAAYERARDSYEAAIRQYQTEISRLQSGISGLTTQITGLNSAITSMETTTREKRLEAEAAMGQLVLLRAEYEAHMEWCSERIRVLRSRLGEAGIPPDDLFWPA